jgi:hypothetical protein
MYSAMYADGVATMSGDVTAPRISIKAKVLKGHGFFNSDNIIIICDEFMFAGTMHCNGICTIRVKKDFDYSMFKKEGTGTFRIIVSEREIALYDKQTLLNKVDSLILKNSLITEEQIKKHLVWLHQQIFDSQLNGQEIVQAIQDKVEQMLKSDNDLVNENAPVSNGQKVIVDVGPEKLTSNSEFKINDVQIFGGAAILSLLATIFCGIKFHDKTVSVAFGTTALVFFILFAQEFKKQRKKVLKPFKNQIKIASNEIKVSSERPIKTTPKMPPEKLLLIQNKLIEIFAESYMTTDVVITL